MFMQGGRGAKGGEVSDGARKTVVKGERFYLLLLMVEW